MHPNVKTDFSLYVNISLCMTLTQDVHGAIDHASQHTYATTLVLALLRICLLPTELVRQSRCITLSLSRGEAKDSALLSSRDAGPSAQRFVWAARQPLGNASLGALFA